MVWRTDAVGESERFAFYREAICKAFMALAPETDEQAGFSALVESVPLGDGAVNRVVASPHQVIRTARELSSAPRECYYVNLKLAGECTIVQRRNEVRMRPGEVAIFQSFEPFRVEHPVDRELRVASFWVPRDKLDAMSRAGARFDGLLLSDHPIYGPLLTATARALARNASLLSQREAAVLFDTMMNLVMLSAQAAPEDQEASNKAIGSARLQAALDYIQLSLRDPTLSVARTADHVGISQRYIHKLFERLGTSFTRYVIDQRLTHIHNELTRPARHNSTISAIAYRWGFSDLSHFNKVFKAKYAATPGDLRRGGSIH